MNYLPTMPTYIVYNPITLIWEQMMRTITGKDLESWKVALAKSGIKYETDDEYQEAIYNLVNYFDTLIQMDQQQQHALSEVNDSEQAAIIYSLPPASQTFLGKAPRCVS